MGNTRKRVCRERDRMGEEDDCRGNGGETVNKRGTDGACVEFKGTAESPSH